MSDKAPDVDTGGVGEQIGSYRLLRLLGGRSSGPVYEVERLSQGGRAAMRVLPPEQAAAVGAIQRLFSDIRALNEIKNPHLVEVTELIEADRPGGVSAIVMEMLGGRLLARVLAEEKTLPTERVIFILAQVLDALKALHRLHLVHGDLKPENIFLTGGAGTDDYVKLLGVGLARSVTAGQEADHRTDIYSFGVVLYQLLCGRLPFAGRNPGELLVELETDSPPPAPRQVMTDPLGRTLDSIARRCLEKDPAKRWASAEELKNIFDGLLCGETVEIPGGIEFVDDSVQAGSRRRWVLAASLAALVLLGGGALRWRATRPTTAPAIAPQPPAAASLPDPSPPAEAKPLDPPAEPTRAEEPAIEEETVATPEPAKSSALTPAQKTKARVRPQTSVRKTEARAQPETPARNHNSPPTRPKRPARPVSREGTLNPFGD